MKIMIKAPTTNTNVRCSYTKKFARALGREGLGKGIARRKDVKVWAARILKRAMVEVIEHSGKEE